MNVNLAERVARVAKRQYPTLYWRRHWDILFEPQTTFSKKLEQAARRFINATFVTYWVRLLRYCCIDTATERAVVDGVVAGVSRAYCAEDVVFAIAAIEKLLGPSINPRDARVLKLIKDRAASLSVLN